MADKIDLDKLDWQHSKVTGLEHKANEVFPNFDPRVRPQNLFAVAGYTIKQMDPKVYVISCSNGHNAFGIVKYEEELKGEHPATMQFGNWLHREGSRIPIGSSIIVKSYRHIMNTKTKTPMWFTCGTISERDVSRFSIFAATIAVDWAFVEKPKITKALGFVTDFDIEDIGDRQRFYGEVYDQENGIFFGFQDHHLPEYVKKPVDVESAVVIQWIRIKEPHAFYTTVFGGRLLFPCYATKYLDLTETDSEYWLHRVDTHFV